MSPSCKFNNIVLPHHLCNHVTLLTCISCVILLLQNNLFNILGIQWGLFILIELHIIPVELWVIECVCVELLNEVTQAWISISYSGGCSRMCHRHFNMSKIHLMMLCSAKWRRLNSSCSFFSLIGLEMCLLLASTNVPACSLMPFPQVVVHTAVWDKKHTTRGEPCIPKEVPVERYLYFIDKCIPPQHTICDWTVPPTEWVDEKEIEVAGEKTLLWQEAFSVVHEHVIGWGWEHTDVCSVYGTNTLVEIFEVGASKDCLCYRSPVHWKMYLRVWGDPRLTPRTNHHTEALRGRGEIGLN